jgi:hypothetical protein
MATEAMAAIDRSNETDGFVWIQTSVFLHYQFLRRFSLEMPPSWQLDRRCVLRLAKPRVRRPLTSAAVFAVR